MRFKPKESFDLLYLFSVTEGFTCLSTIIRYLNLFPAFCPALVLSIFKNTRVISPQLIVLDDREGSHWDSLSFHSFGIIASLNSIRVKKYRGHLLATQGFGIPIYHSPLGPSLFSSLLLYRVNFAKLSLQLGWLGYLILWRWLSRLVWWIGCFGYLGSQNIIPAEPGENVSSPNPAFESSSDIRNPSGPTIRLGAQASWRVSYILRRLTCVICVSAQHETPCCSS